MGVKNNKWFYIGRKDSPKAHIFKDRISLGKEGIYWISNAQVRIFHAKEIWLEVNQSKVENDFILSLKVMMIDHCFFPIEGFRC